MSVSQIFITALAVIAAIVSFFQFKQKPTHAWPWIVTYWVVLTIKNVVDLVAK